VSSPRRRAVMSLGRARDRCLPRNTSGMAGISSRRMGRAELTDHLISLTGQLGPGEPLRELLA